MTQAVTQQKEIRIGEYIVTGKIGQGGIAEIYKARQESLDRDVAIKILSLEMTKDTDIVRRFEREAIVIAQLNHPNIVHVIDRGTTGSRYYFVMEFVDGTTLREVIDSTRIPLKTKLEMISQVCKALDYAHKNGIIHRDIKPTNVLVDKQGNAHVVDFGIAQIISTPDQDITSSDVIMGTLAYMSPEQKLSTTNVDQTTDIYAVGVMLYEILVGKKPMGHFKMPSEAAPAIGKVYDTVVMRCLAQEPKDRYQTAVELKDDLLDLIDGGQARPTTDAYSLSGSESFVGKCRYLDTIKETRFGSTILVEHKMSKKLYVIKKHQKGQAGRKEATLLSSLKHENIINILGSGGDAKSTVIISDYAQGGSLAERMVRCYEWRKAMDIIVEVASGTDFAHKNNIVHGNLRPSNVLIDAQNRVKVCDFGLPIHYDAANKKNWYSAPERKISKQGDIYAIGIILYQMLFGCNPKHDAGGNLWLDEVRNHIPNELQKMLKKLLAIRVSRRYRSAEELLLDWEDFQQREKEAEARKALRSQVRETPIEKKNPPVWAIAAAVGGFILTVAVVLFFFWPFK